MNATLAPAKITYRKTKADEWVAYGPASEVVAGTAIYVTKRSGERKPEAIARTGRPFVVEGVEMVYGYLGEQTSPRTSPSRRMSRYAGSDYCPNDGDCWSVGFRGCRSCGS